MSSGKGKERVTAQENDGKRQSTSNENPENSSMISRIAASASGLSKNTFSTPTSTELNNTASSALSNSGKAQSSTARGGGSSTWAESSKQPQQQSRTSANTPGSLRLGHGEQHINESEQDFSNFLDGIDSFTPSEQTTSSEKIERGVDEAFEYAWTRSQTASAANIPVTVSFSSVEAQEKRDGDAVLAILSDPNSLNDQYEEPPDEEDMNQDWGLSEEQLVRLRTLTQDLFPPFEPHGVIHGNHPLDSKPDFGLDSRSQITGFGVHDQSMESTEEWRNQWEGVLTRYADEVWGGLLPLVKEARKEVEELSDERPAIGQTKALRRLGAILGHLPPR